MSAKKMQMGRQAPGGVLVSPISVAHRNRCLDSDSVNPVRAQWMANLKKRADAASSPRVDDKAEPMKAYGHIEYTGRSSVRVEPKTSAHVDILPKKLIKPLLKKRPNCPTMLELQAGKPRTPRRKMNGGGFESDMQIQTGFGPLDGCFPGVGTPTAHHRRGPASPDIMDPFSGIDFGPFDTFLDLPTPKNNGLQHGAPPFPVMEATELANAFQQPPLLVRATSVEQEGLSLCFEHTHLGQPTQLSSNVPPSPFGSMLRPSCVFDSTKHHPEFDILDFNDSDIDKEVDSFYFDDDHDDSRVDHDEIELIST
ncbi:hypothetical protein SDRG_15035 [Saprolegnia diclina VS20]|uniref:Uncharacterized protein n=1 Tax=Saprolegnia diclina (strain VS20) TaxID=1156394 RepID=T0PNY2_SAPDV|nr:hypothetical protein SDRG_15035 [Saprolegnia diclina VS20]EQC27134.1 hypothetical protein SDRG_15035 [Saprolegnia diclina VS20]|eukprot:XP_008619420.1 hypothetical protein SDRG_15035 [Saprolegnia diclina VS20]